MKTSPLAQLLLFRVRLFFREPSAVFWTYGFPILLTVSLGIAFRNRPPEKIAVAIEAGERADAIAEVLTAPDHEETFSISVLPPEECAERLRIGRAAVVVTARPGEGALTYAYDPTRPESLHAQLRVDNALQRAAGRADPLDVDVQQVTKPGSRYIDFLLPGLLGMNLMGSGLWGVGFVAVDLRVRKLLKRFTATPMRRSHFLWSMIGARMLFTLPEMIILLAAGVLLFDVPVVGNYLSIFLVVAAGGACFAGLGLLVASRAQRIETVSGLMNLVMLPMWLLSGIFFSTENFPDVVQPLVLALPLTHLNNALRAVILEGAPLASQWLPMLVLLAIGGICFHIAVKVFRWS
jgi:ABC-2 type transport system permease protein